MRAFLSYRRDDSSGWTGRLADDLEQRHQLEVFRDVTSIEPGEEFRIRIETELARADVVMVVIGPRWESAFLGRPAGEPDFVQIEVERALALGRPLLPVLVGGASVPGVNALPAPVRPLLGRNALVLDERRWSSDVAALVSGLRDGWDRSPLPDRRPAVLAGTCASWLLTDTLLTIRAPAHLAFGAVLLGVAMFVAIRSKRPALGGRMVQGISLALPTLVLLLAASAWR